MLTPTQPIVTNHRSCCCCCCWRDLKDDTSWLILRRATLSVSWSVGAWMRTLLFAAFAIGPSSITVRRRQEQHQPGPYFFYESNVSAWRIHSTFDGRRRPVNVNFCIVNDARCEHWQQAAAAAAVSKWRAANIDAGNGWHERSRPITIVNRSL